MFYINGNTGLDRESAYHTGLAEIPAPDGSQDVMYLAPTGGAFGGHFDGGFYVVQAIELQNLHVMTYGINLVK